MNTMKWVSTLALGAALMVGACDRSEKDTPKSPTPTPPAPDVTPKADVSGTTPDAGVGKAPVTSTTLPTAEVATTAPATKPAEKVNKAQELIDKAMTAMKDKRTADARQYLDNAEALGDESMREVIKTARTSLEALEKVPAEVTLPTAPTQPAPKADEDDNK